MDVLIISVLVGFGVWLLWKMFIKSPAPNIAPPELAGMCITHSHDNIGLDSKSGKLWVRDEKGLQAVLNPDQITGWQVDYLETHNALGVTWPHKVYLSIKTKDIDKPVRRMRFKRYGESHVERRNLEECREWADRLTAFYNHSQA